MALHLSTPEFQASSVGRSSAPLHAHWPLSRPAFTHCPSAGAAPSALRHMKPSGLARRQAEVRTVPTLPSYGTPRHNAGRHPRKPDSARPCAARIPRRTGRMPRRRRHIALPRAGRFWTSRVVRPSTRPHNRGRAGYTQPPFNVRILLSSPVAGPPVIKYRASWSRRFPPSLGAVHFTWENRLRSLHS